LVAASSTNLKSPENAGTFREDLYYQVSVVPIVLPPLRERAEDTVLIAKYLIEKFAERFRKEVTGISKEAMAALRGYAWPGNIRELENVIERAVLLSNASEIQIGDLPREVTQSGLSAEANADPPTGGEGLKEQIKAAMSQLERELIQKALNQTHSNVTHAARLLKISRKGLQLKMKELGLREQGERSE
jgi:DNA-binding NtrC family response regulator